MEEARLTAYLFQRLQDAVFLTEHNMARQLGLSYKALQQIRAAERTNRKTADTMERRCNTVCATRFHWTVTSRNTGKEKIPL